jgi:pantetheine-phosphate adenylyltransferase
MFSVEERCEMIGEVLPTLDTGDCRVVVDSFSGLTADFAKRREATAIVRGIRAVSDYEYELRMALMNRRLEPTIETVFLMAGEEYSYVSSTLMKQVFQLGGRVEGLIPELVEIRMREKAGKTI